MHQKPTRMAQMLLGSPQETRSIRELTMPKRLALPVFGADGLSAVAYAPDEIIMVLALSGTAVLTFSPWVGLSIGLMLLVVVGTYRYNIREVSQSGGDVAMVSRRLGTAAGTATGASLLFDFVLTVAVSAAAASSYLSAVFPALIPWSVPVAGAVVMVLTLAYLRGLRFIGRLAPVPALAFTVLFALTLLIGTVESWLGTLGQAPSTGLSVQPNSQAETALSTVGVALLLARAFSSGAVTLTGVESLGNSVRFFRAPKAHNAALTLMVMGGISMAFLVGVLYLAQESDAVVTMNNAQLYQDGVPVPEDFHQIPVLGQVAVAVFGAGPMASVLMLSTVALLLVAPATAYVGFPILASSMARQGYLPVHFRAASSRMLFGNGVLVLGMMALITVVAFRADVNDLIQLYVLGVLFSLSMTQLAVIRSRHIKIRQTAQDLARRRLFQAQAITVVGLAATVLALLVVLVTKLFTGAWVTVLVVTVLTLVSLRMKRHYDHVDQEIAVTDPQPFRALPSRVRALVVVPRLDRPALRAISYARAARPASIEAVVTSVDETATKSIREQWDALEVPIQLTLLASPYRDPITPVIEHVHRLTRNAPRDVIMVYLPEIVFTRPWHRLFHQRTGRRIVRRLSGESTVITVLVPWRIGREGQEMQLPETSGAQRKDAQSASGRQR